MKKFLALPLAAVFFAGCAATAPVAPELPDFRAKGPADAPVTLVEFSDFECPFCHRAQPTVEQILEKYGDQVRLEFRHLPLESLHPGVTAAHLAAECAGEQGKFWEAHDALFVAGGKVPTDFVKNLGLDGEKFAACEKAPETAVAIYDDQDFAQKMGVSATPTFFLDGEQIRGAQPFAIFDRKISAILAK